LRRALKRLDEGGVDLAVVDAIASALLDALRKTKVDGPGVSTVGPGATPSEMRRLIHDLRSAAGTLVTWCHVLRRGGLSQVEIERAAEVLERTIARQIALAERLAAAAGAGAANEAATTSTGDDAEPAGVSVGAVGEVDLRGIHVLIVDDDADARDAMQRVLAQCGADVATAVSAIDAFDVLQRGRPDVLVSDIVMPDADGYALLRRVRAPDTGERGMIPAIAVTGKARAGDRHRALGAGYQIHLVKPVQPSKLIEAVRNLSGR
jgi:CheY-like chemotaxis protein